MVSTLARSIGLVALIGFAYLAEVALGEQCYDTNTGTNFDGEDCSAYEADTSKCSTSGMYGCAGGSPCDQMGFFAEMDCCVCGGGGTTQSSTTSTMTTTITSTLTTSTTTSTTITSITSTTSTITMTSTTTSSSTATTSTTTTSTSTLTSTTTSSSTMTSTTSTTSTSTSTWTTTTTSTSSMTTTTTTTSTSTWTTTTTSTSTGTTTTTSTSTGTTTTTSTSTITSTTSSTSTVSTTTTTTSSQTSTTTLTTTTTTSSTTTSTTTASTTTTSTTSSTNTTSTTSTTTSSSTTVSTTTGDLGTTTVKYATLDAEVQVSVTNPDEFDERMAPLANGSKSEAWLHLEATFVATTGKAGWSLESVQRLDRRRLQGASLRSLESISEYGLTFSNTYVVGETEDADLVTILSSVSELFVEELNSDVSDGTWWIGGISYAAVEDSASGEIEATSAKPTWAVIGWTGDTSTTKWEYDAASPTRPGSPWLVAAATMVLPSLLAAICGGLPANGLGL